MLIQFLDRLWDHWFLLMGILFMIEPAFDYWWEGYEAWADKFISRKRRTRIAITLSVLAVLGASVWAFNDEYKAHQHDLEGLHQQAALANERLQEINGKGGYKDRVSTLEKELTNARNVKPKEIVKIVPVQGVLSDVQKTRDPDSIYQLGVIVATVVAPEEHLSNGVIAFGKIVHAQNLNTKEDFEYRDFVLHFERSDTTTGFSSGGIREVSFNRVICKIVKRR
jgi:hypothetical protein